MKKRIGLLFWLSVLFFIILACTLPTTVPTPAIDIDATLISLAFTQDALENQPVVQQPTVLASVTSIPTLIATLPPSIPVVTVSIDTNCRSGPSADFNYLTALLVGEQAEVIGKYTLSNPAYWIVKKGTVTCWLWGQYAKVEGDTNGLPEIASPPTPSPIPIHTFTLAPTASPSPSPSPVPTQAGDLVLIEFFQLANNNIAVRVGTNPVGSLSGDYVYTVIADGNKVKEWVCNIPVGTELCDTGYSVSGTQIIEVLIDTNGQIKETDETNNIKVLTCVSSTWTCK